MAGRNAQALVSLPEKIKEKRESKGMTQTELGLAMGTNKSAVCKMEKGDRIPDLTTLASAADAMDISMAELFADTDSNPFSAEMIERAAKIPQDKRQAFYVMIESAFTMMGV